MSNRAVDPKAKILAVDDEQASLNAIKRTLRHRFEVILASDGESALRVLKNEQIAVLLADQRMPEMTGVELFREAIQIRPNTVRILITGYTDIETTIEAINQGQVYHYIDKPWEPEELRHIIRRAVEHYRLVSENERLMRELQEANEKLREENIALHRDAEKKYEFKNIIGQSPAMQEVFQLMHKVISTDTTVLLIGETGTGKELIAKAIHYNGPRKDGLFVAQNCGALPDTLLESELFGHKKGSFTGATKEKRGLFEIADGGTIFLDEIADTSPAFQQRLLRVLQDGDIRPLGSEESIKVSVRVISATNKDLKGHVRTGEFREDLFYRLSVFPIRIPSLRERQEDIPLLVDHFLKKYQEKQNKNITGISKTALDILVAAELPGNVRELENEIERAVTLADNESNITPELLSESIKGNQQVVRQLFDKSGNLKETVESLEKQLIREKLRENNGNITHTARDLGLSRVGLQKKIKRYQL